METPDCSQIIMTAADEYGYLLRENEPADILEFMQIVGEALAREDPGFGYITKTEGEKHIVLPTTKQRIAIDSFLYKPTMEVIDVLTNAMEEEGTAGATWRVHHELRPGSEWYPILNKTEPGYDGHEIPDVELRLLKVEDILKKLMNGELKIALVSVGHGKVVCADGNLGGDLPLCANRDRIDDWEKFILIVL